jgi:tetratricopeptide (TPR) repeat protein
MDATSIPADEGLAGLLAACTVHITVNNALEPQDKSFSKPRGGTGFFVAPGWVLTCAHVVADRHEDTVQLRGLGEESTGTVVLEYPERPTADKGRYPFPDLALIRVDRWTIDQPCAWLGEVLPALDARLFAMGYTGTWDPGRPSREPALFTHVGLKPIDGGSLLQLAAGEAVPGMSGGPLLDLTSGRVCGILKSTRDARAPRGGWAVPVRVLRELQADVWASHDRFHQGDVRWRAQAERWTELAELLLAPLPQRPENRNSASYLLDPQFEVVPFRGRNKLLGQLERWCEEPGGLRVRLITGTGGQGKSRLAHRLANRMASRGWLAGLVKEKLTDPALDRLQATSMPCLLVLDYAEGGIKEINRLVDGLFGTKRTGPVRLLLLARGAGDWWEELCAATRQRAYALEGTVKDELPPLNGTLDGRQRSYDDAVVAFAQRLGRDPPEVPGKEELADPKYGSVLYVHMAALAALLPISVGDSGGQVVGDPVARILDHERRYWRRAAEAVGLPYDQRELSRAVAAVTLCGAEDETQAIRLLQRVPGLPDAGQVGRLVRLLRRLYPSNTNYLAGITPDLLGEELVAQMTADRLVPGGPAELLAMLLAEASDAQVYRALTVLARAVPRHPHLRAALGPLLLTNPERLLPSALTVATQARDPEPIVGAVQQALDGLAQDPLILDLVDWLPTRSVTLADLALEITERALRYAHTHTQPESNKPEVARLLNNLSNRLAEVGRYDDALYAIEQATAIWHYLDAGARQLAASDPDVSPDYFLDRLAGSLNNLSASLANVGRQDDALAAIEEAVRHYRRLAPMAPDPFLRDLVMALNNYSNRLSDVGRSMDALYAIEEAVSRYRPLPAVAPDAFPPDLLAMMLENLSACLTDVSRQEDALTAIEQAIWIRRRLAMDASPLLLHDLAMALSKLSNLLAKVSRHDDALHAVEEATVIWRHLSTAGPDAFLPYLAMALSKLSNLLAKVSRHDDALHAVEEATAIRRQGDASGPDSQAGPRPSLSP